MSFGANLLSISYQVVFLLLLSITNYVVTLTMRLERANYA